ncbi:FtsX-like permease family protein [Paenibacillus popilliae]|uniref:ABC transporter permease n=1 Tax=Paenibacillus popilliae TaxID=78057 RepID=A0ABY3ATY1_PAEPP|nr:ABC transporter permease [Paenibacillus sp. SDF0028]TQR46196.1 ABC transporter permease [Paenibacillus sp. SDF0028]
MTLFDLVIRSMRKNVKHYFLYFFALIFSTGLYFVFTILQHDPSILEVTSSDVNFNTAFKVAAILLIFIVVMFTVYANHIFLKRRSKEIGIYQLIGLTRKGVAWLLVIENILLGVCALVLGICSGALVSRLFLIILMKLIGYEGHIAISFTSNAIIQTVIVFAMITLITSVQMISVVYNSTLLVLFQADKQGEHPKKMNVLASAALALLGIALTAYGYYLSGHMTSDNLLLNMLSVLASTISGTYLLFRVTIGWLFYVIRQQRNGHLGLKNSLSLAPLMHRMKANANSLTLITVLSAMTLTMVAIAYSLYYSAESDTRMNMPYDFIFENNERDARAFRSELEKEGLTYSAAPIESLNVKGSIGNEEDVSTLLIFSAEQLRQSGMQVAIPGQGESILYDARIKLSLNSKYAAGNFPMNVNLGQDKNSTKFALTGLVIQYAMNFNVYGDQLVVSEQTMNQIKKSLLPAVYKSIRYDTFQIPSKQDRAKASKLYAKYIPEGEYMPDFHTQVEGYLQSYGLFIFITGFLGLIFLISTGSILYFKQMSEAEQEKQSYRTLRQLGFDVQDIMSGIIRKQLFVFSIPLALGILHSIFAVKAASILLISNITIPTAIAMGVYTFIYCVFALLSIRFYRTIIQAAM